VTTPVDRTQVDVRQKDFRLRTVVYATEVSNVRRELIAHSRKKNFNALVTLVFRK